MPSFPSSHLVDDGGAADGACRGAMCVVPLLRLSAPFLRCGKLSRCYRAVLAEHGFLRSGPAVRHAERLPAASAMAGGVAGEAAGGQGVNGGRKRPHDGARPPSSLSLYASVQLRAQNRD